MKECTLPDDRSPEPSTKLIEDQRIARVAAEIVKPIVGIEGGIAMEVINAAMKFIRSRTGRKLDLAGTASKLRIDGRGDHADFLDHIHARKNHRTHAGADPLVHHADAIACDVQRADSRTCKVVSNQPSLGKHEAKRVAVGQRKFQQFSSVDDSTNRDGTYELR